jgi:hypothetical protein
MNQEPRERLASDLGRELMAQGVEHATRVMALAKGNPSKAIREIMWRYSDPDAVAVCGLRALEALAKYARDHPEERALYEDLLALPRRYGRRIGAQAERVLVPLAHVDRPLEQKDVDRLFSFAADWVSEDLYAALEENDLLPGKRAVARADERIKRRDMLSGSRAQSEARKVFDAFRRRWEARCMRAALHASTLRRPRHAAARRPGL